MKKILILVFGLLVGVSIHAQSLNVVKGKVLESDTDKPIEAVSIVLQGTEVSQQTKADGTFKLLNTPNGKYVLQLKKVGFEPQYFPITLNGKEIDLGTISMYVDVSQLMDDSIISISDDELSEEGAGGGDNVAGLLQSSKDMVQKAIAFNFGQVWFKERGYDSSYGQVSFNGMLMNKISNNRPQWSDWGGLNDVLRNQTFTSGLAASETTFGNVLGTTNFNTRASQYRKGGKVSYAFTNSNYDGRMMASYNTGLMEGGWALTALGSRRFAQEGYMEGSSYNALGMFISFEKIINDKHSINLTSFYTPNRRGKNSPNTQEAYDLGGLKYNAYWGEQDGRKRNARMKHIEEPTVMLGHYWAISDKTSVNTNVMYQTGVIGNSRLEYLGMNPDPTYYQRMPSYSLRKPGFENYDDAYLHTQQFLNDAPESQIMWDDLYEANRNSYNEDAVYFVYDDVNDDTTMAVNSVISTELNDNIMLNGSVMYKNVNSENYAQMLDLLGASYFTDRDKYSNGAANGHSDMNNIDRKVYEGDKLKYNYIIDAEIIDAFAQAQFKYEKADFYLSGNYGTTSYQRDGLYQNGIYQDEEYHSFGKGEKHEFPTYGAKGGITYKISGKHLLNLNAGYFTKAPSLRNAYYNSRVRDGFVPNVTTEKITSADASYVFRTAGIKARITGYYTTFKDMSKVSFYYVDGYAAGGIDTSNFMITAISGMNKKNIGGEFGIEAQVTPTISLTAVAAIGQFTYDNNPVLDVEQTVDTPEGKNTVVNNPAQQLYLKNYKQSGTPQRGYSLGFSYRDPAYWWFSTNANILSHNYISISEFKRTDNFYLDGFGNGSDSVPFNDVTQREIDELLKQEKFENIFLVNVVGGKSWKVNDKYIGFFASINNLLGETFKTGGFEQARKANYETFSAEQELETPTFGNKYWYGRSTSYYLNFYVRF